MFPNPMFIIRFRLNRCITGGPISFKKEVVSTLYVDSVRPLGGEPNDFISWVWCFDVSEPDVFIVFFPCYSFYNGSCPPLVNENFSPRGKSLCCFGVQCPLNFFNIYKNNIVQRRHHLINTALMLTRKIYTSVYFTINSLGVQ